MTDQLQCNRNTYQLLDILH